MGVDNIRDQFTASRRKMIDAFVRVSDLARRAGVDEDTISEAHGLFFDGNVEIKTQFRTVILLAEIRQPRATGSRT